MNQYEAPLLAGLAPAHALRLFGAALLMCLRIRLKKSPNADTATGAAVIGLRTTAQIPDTQGAAKIVRYHLKRNLVAYTSHRQETNRYG